MKELKLFTIKSLKWEKFESDWLQQYSADVPMGFYQVSRKKDEEVEQWGPWKLEWCFDEYYDEEWFEVKSLAAGKRIASENWVKRITPALIAYTEHQ